MLLSVVTVCLNAERNIAGTMASVLEQGADFYEYLIVDGASRDRTMEIVESFRPAFEKKGVRFRAISEKDAGIYDAMNKGARLASGEWLNYMNAGDCFQGPETLGRFRSVLEAGGAEVIYGGTIDLRDDRMRFRPPHPPEEIVRRMPFCHQSAFIRTSLMRERPYDLRYPIFADYDFFLWAYKHGCAFRPVDQGVALFRMGGRSTELSFANQRQKLAIRLKNGAISRSRYWKLMARLALEAAENLFLTKAAKRRREEMRYSEEKGWTQSRFDR